MNSGKIFEGEIKDSVFVHNKIIDDIYLLRLPDAATGFGMDSAKTRFSGKSAFDFLLFKKDSYTIAAELKSIAENSLSFSLVDDKHMIKGCQIISLRKANFYGIKSGFLLNFRKFEETYWLDVEDFFKFAEKTEKKSINRTDVIENGGVLIGQRKKKVKFIYDIDKLFEV